MNIQQVNSGINFQHKRNCSDMDASTGRTMVERESMFYFCKNQVLKWYQLVFLFHIPLQQKTHQYHVSSIIGLKFLNLGLDFDVNLEVIVENKVKRLLFWTPSSFSAHGYI